MSANSAPSPSATGDAATTAAHSAPLKHRVSDWALWFGVAGAPAAWSVQLVSAYALSAHNCFPRLVPLATPEMGGPQLLLSLFALLAIAVTVSTIALATSVRSWRATRHESPGDAHHAIDVGNGRTRVMALSGILISAVFLTALLAQGVLVLAVRPCTQGVGGT